MAEGFRNSEPRRPRWKATAREPYAGIGVTCLIAAIYLLLIAISRDISGGQGISTPVAFSFWVVGISLPIGLAARSARKKSAGAHADTTVPIVCLGIALVIGYGASYLLIITNGGWISTLARLGFLTNVDDGLLHHTMAISLLSFYAFMAGWAATRRSASPRFRAETVHSTMGRQWNRQRVVIVLLAFGAVGQLLTGGGRLSALASRGQQEGDGVVVLLSWGLPLAVSVLVFNRHFGRRRWVVASAVVVAYLVSAGVRSPLIPILIAYVVRVVMGERRPVGFRTIALGLLLSYVAMVGFAAMSQWRGMYVQTGGHYSYAAAIGQTYRSPLKSFTNAGLDTLDGQIFAQLLLDRGVRASPVDVSKTIYELIPHQIWPGKPTWLAVELSKRYLDYHASGMVLSGAGYLELTWGGIWGVMAGYALLGAASVVVLRRTGSSFYSVLWCYLLVRFTVAGDAFDLFHVLGLVLVMVLANTVANRLGWRAVGLIASPVR